MRKKLALAIPIFLVGFAAAFPASINAVDRTASPESPAMFEVSITNDDAGEKRFRVNVNPYSRWFYVENAKIIAPGETENISMTVSPPDNTIQQNYRFTAHVRSQDDELQELTDYFSFKRENDLVIRSVSSNRNQLKPGETVSYTVEILNTAQRRIENYTLEATMNNRTVEKKGLPLSAGSTGVLGLEITPPEKTAPGKTSVKIAIRREGEKEQVLTREIEILKQRKIEKSEKVDNKILVFSKELTARNDGNFRTKVEIQDRLPAYTSPITTVTAEPESVEEEGEGSLYTWSSELDPGETETVGYTINYWAPLVAILTLLGIIVAVKRTRKTVRFTKTAKRTGEGVKVHIEIKNRSSRSIKRVKVEDFIPDIASVEEDFPMARPVIRKTSNGTRLNWEIEELEPGDQRVLEYSIKPLLEVEGGVTLPEAELQSDERKIAETGKVEVEFQPGEN